MLKNKVLQVTYAELCTLVENHPDNADVFKRLAFLWKDTARKQDHFVALDKEKIVAAGSVQVNPHDPTELWLNHISVDPEYKNLGLGKKILGCIFNYSAKSGLILSPGGFEEEGFKYLAPLMTRMHKEYPDLKIRYRTVTGEVVKGSDKYTLTLKSKHAPLKVQREI